MLEGSASIRTVPLGTFNERKGREKPLAIWSHSCRKARSRWFALHWIQEIHRRTFLIEDRFDLNVVSLRPLAIVPATPSTLDGLCGPGQRNGVGSSLKAGERRSTTVDCLRLACCTASQTQQQGRSSSETLQRSQFFACTARSEAQPPARSHSGLVVRFCAHLLRSSSAYVPSARQAGPHAHPL